MSNFVLVSCVKLLCKQECIPVGCILLSLCCRGGVSIPGVSVQEVSVQGRFLARESLSRGVSVRESPPPWTCGNITLLQTSFAGGNNDFLYSKPEKEIHEESLY